MSLTGLNEFNSPMPTKGGPKSPMLKPIRFQHLIGSSNDSSPRTPPGGDQINQGLLRAPVAAARPKSITPRSQVADNIRAGKSSPFDEFAANLRKVEGNPENKCSDRASARILRCCIPICHNYITKNRECENPSNNEQGSCCLKTTEEGDFQKIRSKIGRVRSLAKCCTFVPCCTAWALVSLSKNNQVVPLNPNSPRPQAGSAHEVPGRQQMS